MSSEKTYTKEEVISAALDYFNGDTIAADVWSKKYAMKNKDMEYVEKTPEDTHRRLAKEFARIEDKFGKNKLSEEEIFNLLDRYKYLIPGGSPTFGIGNSHQKVSLSNCFVVDCMDSYGGICRADERIAQISKRRGGVGIDISPIRPKGMKTHNSSLTTDGIGIFMDRFSNTIREVGQHGRRGALMISISVHHPEIMEFINIKKNKTRVTGANISVRVSDEFMKAVRKDKEYEVRWPVDSESPDYSEKLSAKEVWEALVDSNYGRIAKLEGGENEGGAATNG
jgi:ribonucleoside-diphosphate reductase alpha chain